MESTKTAKGQPGTTDERVRQIMTQAVEFTAEAAKNLKLSAGDTEDAFKIQCFSQVFHALMHYE